MDVKFSTCFYLLLILFNLNFFLICVCFQPKLENVLGAKGNSCYNINNSRFNKSSNTFELSLIFRKLKDQSMVKSIPSHIRRRNKKKKKKKKKKQGDKEEKKVNKKLQRRRLLKYYKLKRKSEGKDEDIFERKPQYSVFDYIEEKLKGTTNPISTAIEEEAYASTYGNKTHEISTLKEEPDEKEPDKKEPDVKESDDNTVTNDNTVIDATALTLTKSGITTEPGKAVENVERQEGESKTEDKQIDSEKNKRKKKPEKMKKNMHIGRYRRKIFTYKPKVPVDQIHSYVANSQLKNNYILKKDPLKNVFVNMPLFNFYNFYNYFQIDHVEKYNKSKILNLIYYYLYKYQKARSTYDHTTYKSMKTTELMARCYDNEAFIDNTKKYEAAEKDETKMKHYLELYINMNNNKYLYMNVDKDFTLKNKIKDAFTISDINKVDSLHIHNYKIVWTIRNVKEKMFWRYREMGNTPLTTSAFSFAGKKLFKLKLWLDGHKSAKKKYVSVALKQLQNYEVLDEYICFSLNNIKRGPLVFMSREYYQTCYNFCKVEDLDLKKDELQLSMFLYDGVV